VAVVAQAFRSARFGVAAGLLTAALVASVVLVLRLVGVRHWGRCGLAFLWITTVGNRCSDRVSVRVRIASLKG
jgi:hypothetical protein